MAAVSELRYETMSKHYRLIQQLEAKYINHINALLQQKAMIHVQLQRSLYAELHRIDLNISLMSHKCATCTRTKGKQICKKQNKQTQKYAVDTAKLPTPTNIFIANNNRQIPSISCVPPIPTMQSFISDPLNVSSASMLMPLSQIINENSIQSHSYTPAPNNNSLLMTETSGTSELCTKMNEVIVESDADEQQEKQPLHKEFLCICGDKLREIKWSAFDAKHYAVEYGVVFCDICNEKCKRNKIFYHCNRGKNAEQHREGFDICENCAKQQLCAGKNAKKKKKHKIYKNYNNSIWKCFYCDFSSDTKRNLDSHILSHDGNKRPWQCLFCDKLFMERQHLNIHSKSHQQQKIFSCAYCEFATDKKSLFNMHSRAHLGEKPVQCPVCRKKYCSKVTLQKHIEQQHANGN